MLDERELLFLRRLAESVATLVEIAEEMHSLLDETHSHGDGRLLLIRQRLDQLDVPVEIPPYQRHSMRATTGKTLGWAADFARDTMIVCPICHNGSCPHATDETAKCSGSNEVDQ